MAVPDRTVDLQWRGQASPLTLTLTLSTGIGLQLICVPFLVILSRSTVAVALHGVTGYDELVCGPRGLGLRGILSLRRPPTLGRLQSTVRLNSVMTNIFLLQFHQRNGLLRKAQYIVPAE